MELTLDLQVALSDPSALPGQEQLEKWARAALMGAGRTEDSEITVRFVEPFEIQDLNREYRQIDKPTNILSFPFECPPGVSLPLLGDLIICKEVLLREAAEQGKSVEEHCAHLIVHGCLHLLGYDHIQDDEAEIMEALESKIVMSLGYPDPYLAEKSMD